MQMNRNLSEFVVNALEFIWIFETLFGDENFINILNKECFCVRNILKLEFSNRLNDFTIGDNECSRNNNLQRQQFPNIYLQMRQPYCITMMNEM